MKRRVAGARLSAMGNDVTRLDLDPRKIHQLFSPFDRNPDRPRVMDALRQRPRRPPLRALGHAFKSTTDDMREALSPASSAS